MPFPTLGPFGADYYARLAPLQFEEEELDYPLAKWAGAAAEMVEDIEFLVRDTDEGDPGWSVIMDVNRCPVEWLPWLGQFVGTEVDATLSENEQRQQIRDEENFRRGSVQDLITRIKRHLTGRKIVILRERDFSPYHFSVVLYSDDTSVVSYTYEEIYDGELIPPTVIGAGVTYNNMFLQLSEYDLLYQYGDGASSDILGEIRKKPGGLVYRLAILDGQDYWEIWLDYASYQDVYDHYLTYQEIFDDAPVPHPFPFERLLWYSTYKRVWNSFQTYQTIWDRETTY